MTRKEIVFLSGRQILIIMIIMGNALVIGFIMRYHSYKSFLLEDADIATFTEVQKKEREVKEEIRKLEGKKYWTETEYAKKNSWSNPVEKDDFNFSNLLKK